MDRFSKSEMTRMFRFLDHLRSGGSINMLGATIPLMQSFAMLRREDAKKVLILWMETFDDEKTVEDRVVLALKGE